MIAVLALAHLATGDTPKGGGHADAARARLDADVATGRAGVPRRPWRHDTVDRALVVVAAFLLGCSRAGYAAVKGAALDVTGAAVQPPTAGVRALAPLGPRAKHAVDGACSSFARLRFGQERAHVATKGRLRGDRARAALRAGSARLGARGPRGPGRCGAVHWARALVALLSLDERAARRATVRGFGDDAARACVRASSARRTAVAPWREGGSHTGDGARCRVARLRRREARASKTAVRGLARDSTRTRLYAASAAHSTPGPRTPRCDDAVDRARRDAARLGLDQEGAAVTAVGRRHGDRARARLRTPTACLRAR